MTVTMRSEMRLGLESCFICNQNDDHEFKNVLPSSGTTEGDLVARCTLITQYDRDTYTEHLELSKHQAN